jgi:hypothetical protein
VKGAGQVIDAKLAARIETALRAVPFYFESSVVIEGVEARDLFSLNAVLGSTIEVQTVLALNKLRAVWDPEGVMGACAFQRSSQVFPDVRLVDKGGESSVPLIGIELKGWYVLTREKAPTFRYKVTPTACGDNDLLVVVPWYLSNVLSGRPVLCAPFIVNAREAAERRNTYWVEERRTGSSGPGVIAPANVSPYPHAGAEIADTPADGDKGNNFGRIARIPGFMDAFILATLQTPIAGIAAKHWIDFFAIFVDTRTRDDIEQAIRAQLAKVSGQMGKSDEVAVAAEEMTNSLLALIRTVIANPE